jgi:hypothetical protein
MITFKLLYLMQQLMSETTNVNFAEVEGALHFTNLLIYSI